MSCCSDDLVVRWEEVRDLLCTLHILASKPQENNQKRLVISLGLFSLSLSRKH